MKRGGVARMERSELNYFEQIFIALNRKRVKYLLIGGVAINLYGIERMTADVDLMLELEENNLRKFVAAMGALGYKPKVPVKAEDLISASKRQEWIREKGMTVFSFYHPKYPFRLVDVLIETDVDFVSAYAKRTMLKTPGTVTPLADVDTLIALKTIADRPQDRADIEHLRRIGRYENKR